MQRTFFLPVLPFPLGICDEANSLAGFCLFTWDVNVLYQVMQTLTSYSFYRSKRVPQRGTSSPLSPSFVKSERVLVCMNLQKKKKLQILSQSWKLLVHVSSFCPLWLIIICHGYRGKPSSITASDAGTPPYQEITQFWNKPYLSII